MPVRRLTLCLLAATALVAGGCGDGQDGRTRDGGLGPAQADDAAFKVVAAAQIENAIGYSEAVLKSSQDAEVKDFAGQVIAERDKQQALLADLPSGQAPKTVSEAATALNIPLADLAVSADGQPLAAPSSDNAYVKAMRSNLNASIRAASVERGGSDEATKKLAERILANASSELDQLRSLP